jgi:hypothetical protein
LLRSRQRTAEINSLPQGRSPSVAHYLIVDPGKSRIVHHERAASDTILTRIVSEGTNKLDPPGLEIEMADIYAA